MRALTKDGDKREARHGHTAILRVPNVGEGSSDQDRAARSEDTRKETSDDFAGDVCAFREEDEDEDEAGVGGKENFATADELAEGSEEERSNGARGVEAMSTRNISSVHDYDLLSTLEAALLGTRHSEQSRGETHVNIPI